MKILFVNQVVGPLFAELIFAKSVDVTESAVLCGSGGDLVEGSGAEIVAAPVYNKTSMLKRFTSWSNFSWFFFWFVWKRWDYYDSIVFTTNSPFNTVSVAILRLMGWRCEVDYMVYDIYPEVIYLRWPSAKYLVFPFVFFRLIDSFVIRESSRVFTLSNSMSETIKGRSEIGRDVKLTVLPVVARRPEISDCRQVSRAKVELIIGAKLNELVLIYSGNLGVQHDLSHLVRAVQNSSLSKQVSLIICGDGELRGDYLRISTGSKNTHFLPFQEQPEFEALLNSSDISVVSVGGGFGNALMPSKFATYISYGLPVLLLGSQASELAAVINANGIGWSLSESTTEIIERLLFSIITKEAIVPSRAVVKEYFTNSHTTNTLQKVLNEEIQ